jgi:hypothetical protein
MLLRFCEAELGAKYSGPDSYVITSYGVKLHISRKLLAGFDLLKLASNS